MKIPEKPPKFTDLSKNHDLISLALTSFSGTDEKSDELRKLVRKYNEDEYVHWDNLRRKKLQFDPNAIWWLLFFQRSSKFKTVIVGNKTLKFIVLNKFQKQLHLIDKGSPSSFDSLFGVSPKEGAKQQYLINSLMEEAIASSILEGAATTRQIAKKFLREGKKPKNTAEKMILNNFRTVMRLKTIKDQPLTKELILEIHREICNGTLDDVSDEINYRTTDDIIVQDKKDATPIYYPPPAADISSMLDGVCEFTNNNDEFIHPIIKAIVIHFMIGFIHPFNDGNGRTARALFYWYVLKNHYDLFEYLSISRIFVDSPAQYARAYLYSETDDNDVTYFIDYNMEILSKAMDDLRHYIDNEINEEKEATRIFTETPGLSLRQAEILMNFIKNSTKPFSIGEIAGKYGLSIPTARNDLLSIEKTGKVRKYKDGKRWLYMLLAEQTTVQQ
jgi:Fic family protein